MVNNFNQLNIFNRERLLINKYIALQGLFCNGHKFNLFDITIPDEVQSAVRELNAEKVEIISQTNREGFTCLYILLYFVKNRGKLLLHSMYPAAERFGLMENAYMDMLMSIAGQAEL